uniref:DNA2/NAM7 helicase-like C-terminal domain-containing protein n=1 Tax=Ditylenchus dipsaci TaxID=166011 RepID=A0A915EEA4_9BILA
MVAGLGLRAIYISYNEAVAIRDDPTIWLNKYDPIDFLVVSPYEDQVKLIRHFLNSRNKAQVSACTIDESQGSEEKFVLWTVWFPRRFQR